MSLYSYPILDGIYYHPSLDNSSHPLLNGTKYRPSLDDSSRPLLNGIKYHPNLDDSSHPLLNSINYQPILDVADGVLASKSFWKPSRVPSQIIVSGEGPQIGHMNASAQLISRNLAKEFQACHRSLMLIGFALLWIIAKRRKMQ